MVGGLVTFLLLYLCALASTQQNPLFLTRNPVLSPRVDAFISDILAEWNTPGGVSVAVVKKDSDGTWTVETKGYGNASVDGRQMTEDSLFYIASNSKLFNIIATGLLIANESLPHRISWDTKIASVVPEWELKDPIASSQSTIVDLMSHRTGLPRHDLMYGRTDNVTSILKRLKHLEPSAEFRDIYQYNNNMYMLLSYLPELLLPHKPPFARYVKEHIFEPLGLVSTTYSVDVARASGNLVQGMARDGVNKTENLFGMGTPRAMWHPSWFLAGDEDGNYKSGAGGIISSARDAATWLQALLDGGRNPVTKECVIPPDVIQKVTTGKTVQMGFALYPELSSVVYGGAQSRYTYRGHEIIEHGGSTTGFMTQISRFPSDKLGIAVFSNDNEYGSMLHEIIKWYLVDAAFGLPPIDWNTRIKSEVTRQYRALVRDSHSKPPNPRPPSVLFDALSGTYENSGYGTIDFCFIFMNKTTSDLPSPCHDSWTVLPGAVNTSIPTLLAKWDKAWSTHIMLTHFDGNLFNVSTLESRHTINDTQPFWTAEVHESSIVTAEFSFDREIRGFGLTGGIWGASAEVGSRKGATVQDRAEVWFHKL
ncbi:beta-lactamase/transpeptidase-like protein [Desarmillaria tabescens]|uniref:Beta-lactamase/transpeptidase-like protein n=1 Tax=Armillaria tabescens TaxID=1929756 RepID=A0AA39KBS8_ARMTA|nr:beta-lactamase/transpeptidase-like protein [Desarmillaria tabescens]KAK0458256.1 beta-lactamase/transpeptidase-like protein [Desarmillaria tabescens]